mmetsp:Transcript_30091/g.69415  ORF Transcript_30091/g.69415 Transcript_30091/m.69415 type:complete len:252 (-) Transcript_30091:795-1550(-)
MRPNALTHNPFQIIGCHKPLAFFIKYIKGLLHDVGRCLVPFGFAAPIADVFQNLRRYLAHGHVHVPLTHQHGKNTRFDLVAQILVPTQTFVGIFHFLDRGRFSPNPRMLQQLIGSDTFIRIRIHQSLNDIHGRSTQMICQALSKERMWIFHNTFFDFLIGRCPREIKWMNTRQHDIQNDTHRPHVHGRIGRVAWFKPLRGPIGSCARRGTRVSVGMCQFPSIGRLVIPEIIHNGTSKINHFDGTVSTILGT